MKTQEHLHLAKLFLQVFKIKPVGGIKIHFIVNNYFFNHTFLRLWRKIW